MTQEPLAARLARVAKSLGHGIAKGGRNTHSNYDYTSAAAVNREVGAALSAEGLAVTVAFEVLPLSTAEMVFLRAFVTYHGSGEKLTSEGLGAGKAIKGDEKLLMKAQSVAVKYAHVNAMTLGMGEDPEADPEPEVSQSEPERRMTDHVPPVDPMDIAHSVLVDAAVGIIWENMVGADFRSGEQMSGWIKACAHVLPAMPKPAGAAVWRWLKTQGARVEIGVSVEMLTAAIEAAAATDDESRSTEKGE